MGIRLIVDDDEPALNAGAFRSFGLKQEHMSELARAVEASRTELADEDPRTIFHELMALVVEKTGIPLREKVEPEALGEWVPARLREPGVYNLCLLFAAERSDYYEGLLDELQALRSPEAYRRLSGTALGALFRLGGSRSRPPDWLAMVVPANEPQLEAAISALTRPLTVVTGPPGTGKSQLIVNLLATAAVQGQSVLFASKNNQAVDVVCNKLQEFEPDAVLRTGRREYRDRALEQIRAPSGSSTPGALAPYLALCQRSWETLRSALAAVDKRVALEVELREAVERNQTAEKLLPAVIQSPAAVLDVPPPLLRETAQKLEGLASAVEAGPPSFLARFLDRLRPGFYARRLASRFSRVLARLPEQLREALRAACQLPTLPSSDALRNTAEVIRALAEAKEARQRLEHLRAQDAAYPSYQTLKRRIDEAMEAHLQASRRTLTAARREARRQSGLSPEVRRYVAAVDRRRPWWLDSALEREVVATFPLVLHHFPVWATTSLSAARAFPFLPALFDLLIVDEASQCDIPSVLPLFYRAKRAVIIGDPKQLVHVCTIPAHLDSALARRVGAAELPWYPAFRFSDRSLYHAAEAVSQERPILLDEHYRSHPHIIELSNQLFYGGALTILTDPDRLLLKLLQHAPAVRWVHVEGRAVRPATGSAYNEPEAEAVCAEVIRLHQSLGSLEGTLGVVTPFARQAEHIERLLRNRLSPEVWEQRRLIVATAHRFQGDERDIMVFSPIVAPGIPLPTLRWLVDTPNLFNVAITRARTLLLIIGDREYCRRAGGLLAKVAEYSTELELKEELRRAGGEGVLHSPLEERLYAALRKEGVRVTPKAMIGPYEVDFLIDGQPVVVECDGAAFHGSGRQRRLDMVRDARLQAMGYKVVRLPGWRILADLGGCIGEILRHLGK